MKAEEVDRYVEVKLHIIKEQPIMETTRSVAELLVDLGLHEKPQEEIWVIAIDGARKVRTVYQAAKGTFHDCDVSMAAILMPVLLSGTDRFLVAHNHPSGELTASYNDKALTDRISQSADLLGLMFEDHLIVTPEGDFYSLSGHKQMRLDTIKASGRR